MANKINFSDYRASGVYFLEIDNSVISTSSSRTALRMAVGFNMRGPFNRPVYVAGADDCNKFFGPIDRRLERQGCFTNRMVRTMVRKAPVYVLNLLKTTDADKVGCWFLPFGTAPAESDASTGKWEFEARYDDMYDRTKFWMADDRAFVNNAFKANSYTSDLKDAPFYAVGNCGTKDISVIVKKADVTGYNVTFLEYYGSKDEIPYKWINPNDYVSDYFVDVVLLSGQWADCNALSKDVVWSKYFDENGLKAEMLEKFLRLDAVNVIGKYTGCVIPNFQDKQGSIKAIDYIINSKCNETGLMLGTNEDAMEYVCFDASVGHFCDINGDGLYDAEGEESELTHKFVPDFVGNKLDSSTTSYLSCVIDASCIKTYESESREYTLGEDATTINLTDNQFMVSVDDAENIKIGDYVKNDKDFLIKIIKKRMISGVGCVYTANGIVGLKDINVTKEVEVTPDDPSTEDVNERVTEEREVTVKGVEIHPSIQSMVTNYKFTDLKGLRVSTRHMPGYNEYGTKAEEAGVEKIYSMLSDDMGLRKGLLNDDLIDFRYIVDTMAYGLGENCGGKRHLAALAKEKGHCTAIINAPSMTQFAESDAPVFGPEKDGYFDVAYIPQGGNQDLPYSADTQSFSLPGEDYGADHVGVFAPFLKYAERGRTILVPPAADVSNTFMNKYTGGDPYVTIANRNGILVNGEIAGVEYLFDEDDRGHLETMGINPIIERNAQAIIYGDKTAYQTVNSDLSYLHVREILNTIQLSCKAVLDDYVFNFNIPTVRAEIVTKLNPILRAMKDSGALVRYEIQCDENNNDKEVIDNKFCIVDIGVWISQNMEKIVVPITINRSTTA